MLILLDKKFKKKVRGMFDKYQFEVGVLKDGQHRDPISAGQNGAGTKTLAGGPARRQSRKNSDKTISQVSKELRDKTGLNYLTAPFQDPNSEILKFAKEYLKLVFGGSQKKRVENLLQAIIRNPIVRQDYGKNTQATAKIKGFNRLMIDTGQLFKSIKAVCKVKGR